jgi:small-conductance mechanosensitive channel
MARQLLITALVGIAVIAFILSLPIGDAPRGQLLSLLGLLVTAAIALSATTLVGNAMAGLMLRSIRNFRPGDFIIVNEHRGRVSEKGWLRTEIQTERRNLTTLPNLYLVNNPVTVIRSSGTFISATVSLGYDVPREKVHECLLAAAEQANLIDPFVFVMELGDFSIAYQAAGFLEDVKYLISAESALRESMLDSLHRAGIEIVSPTFMNQRQLEKSQLFIPQASHAKKSRASSPEDTRPEELMFDKADKAESEAKVGQQLEGVVDEIDKLKKSETDESSEERGKAQLEELKQKKAELEEKIREQAERKKAESKTGES